MKQKNSRNIGDGSALGLRKVKDTYTDIDDYLATFEPLLFEEVKAQIVQGRDEEEGMFLSQKTQENKVKLKIFSICFPLISFIVFSLWFLDCQTDVISIFYF